MNKLYIASGNEPLRMTIDLLNAINPLGTRSKEIAIGIKLIWYVLHLRAKVLQHIRRSLKALSYIFTIMVTKMLRLLKVPG